MSTKRQKRRKSPIEFDKFVYPKNIQWMHDWDKSWLQSLPPYEQEWMARFIKEYVNGNVKKGDKKALHKSRRLRQDCYTRKNAQNRDLMSILDCHGKMDRITNNAVEKTREEPLFLKQPFKPKKN